MVTREKILEAIALIPDPEIPVITIKELGILRNVIILDNEVEVTITPTYSACPAMKQIEYDIISTLNKIGVLNVKVNIVYHPTWTTDWIGDAAKEKLRKFGIAPPERSSSGKEELTGRKKKLTCPQCNSENTSMISQFGSTACKALYKCNDCKEAFDYFKCI